MVKTEVLVKLAAPDPWSFTVLDALTRKFGFEDVIEIGRQDRPSLYDPFADRPEPLVERRNRVSNLADVDLDGIEAVAVSLLRSYEDPSREQEIGREAARVAPEAAVSLSSDVVAEFREFERTSTTVLNAYLTPVVADYLTRLEDGVRSSGLADAIAVMRSSDQWTRRCRPPCIHLALRPGRRCRRRRCHRNGARS